MLKYSYVSKIIQCGAMGYVTKNSSTPEMFNAVMEIYNNRKYICEEIKDQQFAEMLEQAADPEQKPLKQNEIEIVNLIREGLPPNRLLYSWGCLLKP